MPMLIMPAIESQIFLLSLCFSQVHERNKKMTSKNPTPIPRTMLRVRGKLVLVIRTERSDNSYVVIVDRQDVLRVE
jgi:hypothetical protein